MKILQVCPKFHPFAASGSTMVAYQISKELARRGHLVVVYTSNMKDRYTKLGSGFEKRDGVRIYRFRSIGTVVTRNMKIFITPQIILSLKKRLRSFDVVHLHEYRSFQNVIVHYYAKRYGVPYVLHAHGSLPRVGSWRILKWIYDALFGYRLLREASKVIALSHIEAEQYRSMGVPEEKIAIIPNGIDLSEYANLPPKGSFKRKFNIPDDKKIILYLGRIHKTKGIDFL
ncbi:MAG: glycosyltransferase, partial [Fervidicoccaceae archaeon]